MDDDQLITKAMDAYASDHWAGSGWPCGGARLRAGDGRDYVALYGGNWRRDSAADGRSTRSLVIDPNRVVAVYSVQPDERSVRRVTNWPADVA
jgi:hypothetical protein